MVGKSSRTNSKNEVTWGRETRPLNFKGTHYGAFTHIPPELHADSDCICILVSGRTAYLSD